MASSTEEPDRHSNTDGNAVLIHFRDHDHLGVGQGENKYCHQTKGGQHPHLQMADKIAQKAHIAVIDPLEQAGGEGSSTAPLQGPGGLLLPAATDLLLIQGKVAQKGHQCERDNQRSRDQRRDGQTEVAEHIPRHTFHQSQGDEHGQSGEGGGYHRGGDLLGSIDTGTQPIVSFVRKTVDVFQYDDGVVHNHTYAHGDAAQTHHV